MCGGGLAPPTQEVDLVVVVGVWWNVIDVIVYLLVAVLYYWHCLWISGGRSKFLGSLRNRIVLLWVCSGGDDRKVKDMPYFHRSANLLFILSLFSRHLESELVEMGTNPKISEYQLVANYWL